MKKCKAIFIVAGHWYKSHDWMIDNGASFWGNTERWYTVKIWKALMRELWGRIPSDVQLIEIGVDKKMTLAHKIAVINKTCEARWLNVDNSLLVSIHINAGWWTWIETFTYKDWKDGLGYGNKLLLELSNTTNWKIRWAKYENQSQHNQLAIVHDTNPLAILIECGFIDNEWDKLMLDNWINNIAYWLYNWIAEICWFWKIDIDSIGNTENKIEKLTKENEILKSKIKEMLAIINR